MALYEREPVTVQTATASVPGAGGHQRHQDAVGSRDTTRGRVLVVADGHEDKGVGGQAAQLVVETILDYYGRWDGKGPRKMLVDSLGMANAALLHAARTDARLAEIGVSAVLLHYHDRELRIAHVGNCRAYRQRNYVIDQLTADHVQRTRATVGPADDRRQAVVLERAVGLHPVIEVDVSDAHFVQAGETYLLCTDGLTSHLSDVEIGRYCLAGEPLKVCDALLTMAGEKGAADSMSVAMAKFHEPPSQQRTSADVDSHVHPSSMSLNAGTPATSLSFNELSGWWKLRMVTLGVLVAWFVGLLFVWWGFEQADLTMLTPLLLGLVFSTAPLVMMLRWRKKRGGRSRL